MHIPEFVLPSEPKRKIQLRDPTVAEMIGYSDILDSFEERLKTKFLNTCQDERSFHDAKLWTVHDRAFALWWYFIHSRDHTTYNLPYTCSHCQRDHDAFYEMKDLRQMGLCELEGLPFRSADFDGKKIHVVPLSGEAAEAIEEEAMLLSTLKAQGEEQSGRYRREQERLSLLTALWQLRVPSVEASHEAPKEALNARREYIYGLSSRKYEVLLTLMCELESDMAHGFPAHMEGTRGVLGDRPTAVRDA